LSVSGRPSDEGFWLAVEKLCVVEYPETDGAEPASRVAV
jgi:hypothetical protein